MKRFSTLAVAIALVTLLFSSGVLAQDDVTFQVDMSVKILELQFDPTEDIVIIRGSHNDWAETNDSLLTDMDGDSVYSETFNMGGIPSYPDLFYKHVLVDPGGTLTWEDGDNREVTLTGAPQVLPVVFFNNDDIVDPPSVDGSLLFTVNTEAFTEMGLFTPSLANDSMEVRGAFNGWSSDPANGFMSQVFGQPSLYELNASMFFPVGEVINYKYFMKIDTTAHGNIDGWEEPATQGGGNRQQVYQGTFTQEAPLAYFMDIPPGGVIPGSVTLNLSVDMNPALSIADPFDPAVDSVFLSLEDQFMGALQGDRTRGVQSDWYYTDDNNDLIYELTIDLQAPLYYAFIYRVCFGETSGDVICEGGGFDFGKSRVRYMLPDAGGNFSSEYTFAMDVYTEDPPLVVEPHPTITGIEDGYDPVDIPASYTLYQNYPNPFNPETTIRFSLSTASEASLIVYNALGQKVRTLLSDRVNAGPHEVRWDARDESGRSVTSGVYFYKLTINNETTARKMVLMR